MASVPSQPPPPSHPFALGWSPDRAAVARQQMLASRRYCTVIPGLARPPAYSLSKHLLREMSQGQAGTCWVHAGVCLCETTANALGYKAFPICRRLVGWVGKSLEGGGNPSNGGAVTDALLAMTSEKGAGIAHEDLLPYSDSSRALGTKPPQNVFDDATKSHLTIPVDIRSDDDAMTLISSNHAVAIGTWWPFNFDDRVTFMTRIGAGTYGHALTKIGYVEPGIWPGDYGKYGWWQVENWHTELYPPLPKEIADLVPGYVLDGRPYRSDAWWRMDQDTRLQNMRNYEYVSATDVNGIDKIVTMPDFIETFPI